MSLRRPHLAIQAGPRLPRLQCIRRLSSTPHQPFPRSVGAGEIAPSTPQPLRPTPWYKRPSFRRQLVNILLLSSFINTTMISMSYKSQLRDISTQAKERQQSLRDAIEKVRKGEPIDLRVVLGTGDPEQEKKWDDLLKEIETEDLNWQRADRGDRDSSEHHASGESEEGKE